MGDLSNYRAVGKFDVLEAPRNPIGTFDAEQFKTDALQLIEKGSRNIVVDLGDLDFLYSDAFNAFSMVHQKIGAQTGTLGILAMDDLAVKSLQQAGVDRYVQVFRSEPELMAASLQTVSRTAAQPAVTTVSMSTEAEGTSLRRTHKFTQSFNSSLLKEAEALESKSALPSGFANVDSLGEPRGSKSWIVWLLLAFLAIGGAAFWFLQR